MITGPRHRRFEMIRKELLRLRPLLEHPLAAKGRVTVEFAGHRVFVTIELMSEAAPK